MQQDGQRVINAITKLNNNYGKGDITFIDFRKRQITCKLQYGYRTYRFKINRTYRGGLTIKLHGHQVTLYKES